MDTIKARSRLALTPAAASGAASFSKAITSSSIRASSKPRAAGQSTAHLAIIDTLIDLIAGAIDVIIPLEESGGVFGIGSVWFAADAARRGETAADLLRET